jgi:hypothetical protein
VSLPVRPVFVDANALVPISLTNLLLRLAEEGLIEPFWSRSVLDDARRWVKALRPEYPADKIDKRFRAMREAFPEAMIDTSGLDPEDYPSKDSGDRLVIGAAHRSPANLIITRNLADFPESTLHRYGMEAQTADRLLLDLLASNPHQVIAVLHEMREALANPPLTMLELLDNLEGAGVPDFAATVRTPLEEALT